MTEEALERDERAKVCDKLMAAFDKFCVTTNDERTILYSQLQKTVAELQEAFHRRSPSPSAEGMQALKATAIQLPIAIAFLGRGPGGENNSDPDKWAQMCASLADQLAALDAIVRAALAEKEQG